MKIVYTGNKHNLSYLHIISSGPTTFYKSMRNEFYIYRILASESITDLISAFNNKRILPIKSMDDEIELYSYVIALTLKEPNNEIRDFFKSIENVNYGYFPGIIELYRNPLKKIYTNSK